MKFYAVVTAESFEICKMLLIRRTESKVFSFPDFVATCLRWGGTAEVNLTKPGIIDAVIEGRQIRVTVIIGILKSSSFIAIPDLYLSFPLAEWKEYFWNAEQLSRYINNIDAITVSAGVRALMEILRKDKTFTWERTLFA